MRSDLDLAVLRASQDREGMAMWCMNPMSFRRRTQRGTGNGNLAVGNEDAVAAQDNQSLRESDRCYVNSWPWCPMAYLSGPKHEFNGAICLLSAILLGRLEC